MLEKFEYKKATIEDIDELVRTRMIVLRAANKSYLSAVDDRYLSRSSRNVKGTEWLAHEIRSPRRKEGGAQMPALM